MANAGKIQVFLENVNKHIFENKGKADGDVSGIVLGENFHFTCHTFCYKNTMFIEYFGDKSKYTDVQNLILDTFPTNDYDLCDDNEDVQGNFGKHIIIGSESTISFDETTKLISTILTEIDMTLQHI